MRAGRFWKIWKIWKAWKICKICKTAKKGSSVRNSLSVLKDWLLQNPEGAAAGILCDVAQFFLDPEELVVLCKSVGSAH